MNDNANKSTRGRNAKNALNDMLKNLCEQKYIKSIEKYDEWSHGEEGGYHLYAPFIIRLFNDEKWVLYTTTSYRSDRVKGDHWNSLLMKKYTDVDRCYLIIADSSDSKTADDIKSANIELDKSKGFDDTLDELDAAMSISELHDMIEGMYSSCTVHGIRENMLGNNFEERIVHLLNNQGNLDSWNGDKLAIGMETSYFNLILNKWGCKKPIKTIYATNSIEALPSRGKPKTDVKTTVVYPDGTRQVFTVSCKNTKSNFVSVHQYKAEDFIKALNITDESLKRHLRQFQECGSVSGEHGMGVEAAAEMEQELIPYVDRLCRWVITGEYGNYSTRDQIAQYIIVYNENEAIIRIYTAAEYIAQLKNKSKGQFGTPFKWTYASKSRGKNIQLKMQVF